MDVRATPPLKMSPFPDGTDNGTEDALLPLLPPSDPEAIKAPCCYIPRRWIVALVTFFGLLVEYAMRVCMTIATANRSGTLYAEFDWTRKMQGTALASFFYGYASTQLVGGWLSSRYGGATVLGWAVFLGAVLTLITPFVAHDFNLLVACRVMTGVVQGPSYPSLMTLLGQWLPPGERARFIALIYSGAYAGTVLAFPLTSIMIEAWGWQSVFYVWGGVGVVWWVVWIIFVSNKPANARGIHESELRLISSQLPHSDKQGGTPWRDILSSRTVWVLMFTNFSQSFSAYAMLTEFPNFLSDVLKYDLTKSGILSTLPYILLFAVGPFSGSTADFLVSRKILSLISVRRLFQTIGAGGATALMIVGRYTTALPSVTVAIMSVSVGVYGLVNCASIVTPLDIGPRHSGVIHGLANTAGTVGGILVPELTGFFMAAYECADPGDLGCIEAYSLLYWISGGLVLVAISVYWVFVKVNVLFP